MCLRQRGHAEVLASNPTAPAKKAQPPFGELGFFVFVKRELNLGHPLKALSGR